MKRAWLLRGASVHFQRESCINSRNLTRLPPPAVRLDDEAHFPLEDCLNEATRLLPPHVEARAKLLAELKEWIETVQEIEAAKGARIWPVTRRDRYRHIPPKQSGDVFQTVPVPQRAGQQKKPARL